MFDDVPGVDDLCALLDQLIRELNLADPAVGVPLALLQGEDYPEWDR